jgi:hypothetical protein
LLILKANFEDLKTKAYFAYKTSHKTKAIAFVEYNADILHIKTDLAKAKKDRNRKVKEAERKIDELLKT